MKRTYAVPLFIIIALGLAISFLLGFTFKVRAVPLLGFEHSRFGYFDEYGTPFVWRTVYYGATLSSNGISFIEQSEYNALQLLYDIAFWSLITSPPALLFCLKRKSQVHAQAILGSGELYS
jgi:hypothetical protein